MKNRIQLEDGTRFGRIVISEYAFTKGGQHYYHCQCDCGNTKIILGASLKNGATKSCGCYRREFNGLPIESGTKFGRLTVIAHIFTKNEQRHYECQCDCGNITIVRSNSLKGGRTKSCGCYRYERVYKHGHRVNKQSPTYLSWYGMKQRCYNPKTKTWKDYGGRGITVCSRWTGKEGFSNFLKDMGERPERMTLDRIDPNGNYEPSNCRWATYLEQRHNRRIK